MDFVDPEAEVHPDTEWGDQGSDMPLTLTIFPDQYAKTKREVRATLREVGHAIGTTEAKRKGDLPFLKMATFGDIRTEKASLRHDQNVQTVTGVEMDYDGGEITISQAVERLTKQGVLALVYQPPGHTEAASRWRVLCPFSEPREPQFRAHMAMRLNGLFGGIFAPESFALSQSYYYGRVLGTPQRANLFVEGLPIDQHDDLDEIAFAPPGGKKSEHRDETDAGGGKAETETRAFQKLLAAIMRGEDFHVASVSLAMRLLKSGVPDPVAVHILRAALLAVPDELRDTKGGLHQPGRWQDRYDDIPRIVSGARGKLGARQGSEGDASASNSDATGENIESLLAEFNARYAVVNEAGKAIIYEEAHDALLNRGSHIRIAFEDFRKLYVNRRIRSGDRLRPAADVWLEHPDRKQFIGGVIFDPSGKHARPDMLNLWRGFAVQPRQGSWARMQAHIFNVVCSGNPEHNRYTLGWMARMAQNPAEQGEVAVVMRSVEGAGKGTLAGALKHIFGQHALAISNPKHLVGNFNGHLRDCVFLFADECFFAGDKAHVGTLKSLITEPHLTIEGKFQTAVQAPNFLHVMMASNEDWVVPASLQARRFFCLDVSTSRVGDHAYFASIREEMENGGYEAMLYDLLSYDLASFNVRRVPVTSKRKLTAAYPICASSGMMVAPDEIGLMSISR